MKFRQRFAWLLLFLYLFLSVVAVYYSFELSDQYNALALEHTKLHHSSSSDNKMNDISWISIWYHLPDIPFTIWIFVFAIFYLQIFFGLYICTKPDPKGYLCAVPCLYFLNKYNLNEKKTCVQNC